MQVKAEPLIDPIEVIKGTAIAAVVGAVFAYLQSIWKKAVKADVDTIIATARTEAAAAVAANKIESAATYAAIRLELKERTDLIERRISQWEQRSGSFVTREAITELNAKIEKMESQIEKAINKVTERLDRLLEGGGRHS